MISSQNLAMIIMSREPHLRGHCLSVFALQCLLSYHDEMSNIDNDTGAWRAEDLEGDADAFLKNHKDISCNRLELERGKECFACRCK